MNLSALGDFHAVAAHGGFARASRATGIAKATLSRRVRALELELGVRLFERGAREMRLTSEGSALRARTGDLMDTLDAIGEEIGLTAGRPQGRLRVSAPGALAHLVLGRFAATFIAAYPDILLEIVADDRFVDPVADGFDVVIRANPEPGDALVGHCLLRDAMVVAAAPSLSIPCAPAEAVVPAVVLTGANPRPIWTVAAGADVIDLRPRPVLRLSSLLMVRDAILAGAGAAIVPQGLVRADLDAGRLNAWGRMVGQDANVWILHPSRRLANAKVRAFVTALIDAYPHASLGLDPPAIAR